MWRRLLDRCNHEYWPWWLIYLPIWPLYLYQAVRQRRAAFFTNVNPAMDMGGFFGESKSAIYALLPEGSFPNTIVVRACASRDEVLDLHRQSGIPYPLIIKPDVGERGEGVERVMDETALLRALIDRPRTMLMQALATGEYEFGLMFAKDPGTGRTALLSVCGKRFLSVIGDGASTVGELLALTWRGRKQLRRLGATQAQVLRRIPDADERMMVEPIGNHCRGTVFFDAAHLVTPALREQVARLMAATNSVHYGRMDVRCESERALREGRFSIIELNGVSSEPGHIYDPSYNVFRCWAELIRHVRRLGPISARLQRSGHEPATLHALVVRCETHFGWCLGPVRRLSRVFA